MTRKTRISTNNYVTVEEETKVGECNEGTMIGEIAMIDPEKATRARSAMAKTDCIFLLLNQDAFDILVRVSISHLQFHLYIL